MVGWDNVTLRGIEDANGDRAIFKLPDERLLTATFDWRTHQYNIPGILVDGSSNIVIDNFDLDFSQVTSELSIGTHRTIGILLLNTINATVSNNVMNDIGSEEQTTQAPLTIEARITPGYAAANGITHQTRADVDITGNTITNGGRVAIAIYGWMEASIKGNTVTTTDDPNFEWDTFGYAIQFTSGAQGTIEGNTFSGFISTSLDRASSTSGALNLHSEYKTPGNLGQVVVNILVKDNTISDSNLGAVVGIVWCESPDGTELDQVVTFEGNTFTDTPLGIGGASCLGNSPDNAASPGDNQDISLIVNNNVFRDIGDDGEDDIAMHLINGGVYSGSSGSISLSAEGNTIKGFSQGLVVSLQEDPNEDNPDPNFGGSLLVSKLNVSHNYWGTAESPFAGQLEIEDGVSLPNGFSYEPWYADSGLITLRTIRYINPLIRREAGLPVTTPAVSGPGASYTLSGADADKFDIGSSTGQITIKGGVDYPAESYTVTVNVTDGTESATFDVVIRPMTVNKTNRNLWLTGQWRTATPSSTFSWSPGDGSGGYATGDAAALATTPVRGSGARIFIREEVLREQGVTTLADLDTVEWDSADVIGYTPFMTVRLSNGQALVVEYAKLARPPDCDDTADYPTGAVDTFGDKGIADGNAYAWLFPGARGGCNDREFVDNHKTLTQWKAEVRDGVAYGNLDVEYIGVQVNTELPILPEDGSPRHSASINNVAVNGKVLDSDPPTLTANQPPTVSVPVVPLEIIAGDSVSLDAPGSTDPEGATLTYAWSQISGPTVTLAGATTATASFTAPAMTATDKFVFTVLVSDIGRTVTVYPGICGRNPQVRDGILTALGLDPSVSNACVSVGPTQLSGIATLDLTDKGITELRLGDFGGLSSMTKLDLDFNLLTALPVGIFDGLSGLKTLEIGNNRLSGLPNGVFDGLTALTHLRLERNRITTLPSGIFDDLDSLTDLFLNFNWLEEVDAHLFAQLGDLQKLYLDRNRLTTLHAGMFDHMADLAHLNFLQNRLISLPDNIFDYNDKLVWLHLAANDLTELPADVFKNLPNLLQLSLYSNGLERLDDNVFDNLNKLDVLYIGGNRLQSLPQNFVDNPPVSLRTLQIGPNPFGDTGGRLPAGFLRKLPAATLYHLELNSPAMYRQGPRPGPVLSDDDVDALTDYFTDLHGLRLSGTGLSADQVLQVLLAHHDSLIRVWLGGGDNMSGLVNDESCLPSNEEFCWGDLTTLWNQLLVYDAGFTADDAAAILETVNPALQLLYLNGNDLSGMTADQLADFGRLTSLSTLRLIDAQLDSAQMKVILDQVPTGATLLFLGGNDLSGLDTSTFARFTNLSHLDLGNTGVTDAQLADLLEALNDHGTLRYLDLSHNNLTNVTAEMFDDFPLLTNLYLHGNPLNDPVLSAGDFGDPDAMDLTVNRTPPLPVVWNRDLTSGVTFTLGNLIDQDGDKVTYQATLAGGTILPSWVSLDGATGTFTLTPPGGDQGQITVWVTGTDDGSPPLTSAPATFTIYWQEADDSPEPEPIPEPVLVPPVESPAPVQVVTEEDITEIITVAEGTATVELSIGDDTLNVEVTTEEETIGARIVLPEDPALSNLTSITFTPSVAQEPEQEPPPQGFRIAESQTIVNITLTDVQGNAITQLTRPCTVCLPVSNELLAEAGDRELALLHYDETDGWQPVPGSERVTAGDGTVSVCAETTQFSLFAVGYKVEAPAPTPAPPPPTPAPTTAPPVTPVPPPATPTATPAPTVASRATPVPPTAVPTATPAPTAAPTATPAPPIAVPTAVPVPTATPAPTAMPTAAPEPTTAPAATPVPPPITPVSGPTDEGGLSTVWWVVIGIVIALGVIAVTGLAVARRRPLT